MSYPPPDWRDPWQDFTSYVILAAMILLFAALTRGCIVVY